MKQDYPAFALFPDLKGKLRTPWGTEYTLNALLHESQKDVGENWLQVFPTATEKSEITADTVLAQRFKSHAERPDYFDPQSNLEPGVIKLNRIPKDKRNDKNENTYIGEFWTPRGVLTIIASPSKSSALHMAGNVVVAKVELAHQGSDIAKYHKPDEARVSPASVKPGLKQAATPA